MLLVLIKTLRGHRLALLLMGLGLVGLQTLIPATYTSFGPDVSEYLKQVPRAFQALLKTQGDLFPLLGAEGYIAIGYRHPIYVVVIAAFTIASTSALAREIERGTIFLLLARPFPRYHLVLAKGGGLLLGLIILLGAGLAGTALGVALADMDQPVRLSRFLLVSSNALLLFLAIGGYGFLFSALSRDGSRAIALTTGLTVAFFFLDFVSELWEPLDFMRPWSIFHYYDPISVIQSGSIPWNHGLVLGGVALACYLTAIAVFQRRDIP
ncbi:MAG: putative antimicrobial peptide exporter permease YclI [Dehalococcoidia bacterium]|nr:putative antimicrobial peptide exporter permease YclI [Dehalococcoidia bacterium]